MKMYLFDKEMAKQSSMLTAYEDYFRRRDVDLDKPVYLKDGYLLVHIEYGGSCGTRVQPEYFKLIPDDLDNLEKWL